MSGSGGQGGRGEAGGAGEGTLAGRVRTCYSEPYLQLHAGHWVPANSLSPAEPHLRLPRGSLAGNCTVLSHQWAYHKNQINAQGVFPLLERGRDCVTAATPRILQLSCAVLGNLYRVERSRKNLSIWVHAALKPQEP